MDHPNFVTLCYGLSKKRIQTCRRQEKKTKTNLFRIKLNEESPHLWEKTKELLKYKRKRQKWEEIKQQKLQMKSATLVGTVTTEKRLRNNGARR